MKQHALFIMKSISISLLALCLSVQAKTVTQQILPFNLTAEANYALGEPSKPAVLILHGFLSTNQFFTVTSISDSLQSEGFTTLAPTLTLNISQRRSLVKCTSLHTHTLQRDIIEIAHWVNWLHAQGHTKIILIGHSSGSLELLEYASNAKNPAISSIILTSLFYLNGPELGILSQEVTKAQALLKNRINTPSNYQFLFCNNQYYATPESFLSYLKMDKSYTLSLLENLNIPSYTIMAGADKRFHKVGREWLDALEQTQTNLITIEGANHFFSREYEFDLQEKIIDILNQTPP
ncbi:MAG: alpha/beta fold hydrolase [Thiomicrorhabdus sp.]|nr:alpha/beta fold hydrolase [Thiomicrorhabdus sp.]